MANSQDGKSKGRILKEARAAQGISLEMVHEMTKIPLDALRAIEEGYSVRNISSFYMKGFLKMYAQHLGVPLEKILEKPSAPAPSVTSVTYPTEQELPQPPKRIAPPVPKVQYKTQDSVFEINKIFTKKQQQWLVFVISGLLVIVGIGKVVSLFAGRKHSSGTTVRGRADVREARRASASVSSAKESTAKASESTEKKTAAVKSAKKEDPIDKFAIVTTSVSAPDKPAPVSTESDVVLSGEEAPASKKRGGVQSIKLTVKAQKKGWLQVKVDGRMVFQSVLESGASETWQAENIIELSGKNIHNLEFEMNGKVLGGLGRADRSARRVIITKDGLAVKE